MKIVPLHCVVFLLGQSANDRARVQEMFAPHETIYAPSVAFDLIGINVRPAVQDVVNQEIHRRMISKLRLGERVVINTADVKGDQMPNNQRIALVNAARSQGVPVFYVLTGQVDREVMRGDGIAEVIDMRDRGEVLHPVPPRMYDPVGSDRFNGVTVIGDVHGMYQSLLSALAWARQRRHFIVLLGDIIDYGPGTIEVADEVYRLVMRGEAAMILGNHERKIMRWLDGERVRLSDGNRTTTTALNHLGETGKMRWAGRFRGLYQNSHLIYSIKNCIFVHGALHPNFWTDGEVTKVVENHAFFGEVDETRSQPERPIRSYRWVDSIPGDRIVVVGHDRRAAKPLVQTNTVGGSAVFLDTGSGKGGVLSSADFRFEGSEQLRMTNFNIF